MKKILWARKYYYTMGQSDHSKTWNPSTLTWYYLCLSALNRNKVCKFHWNMILVTYGEEIVNSFLGMFRFHTPTPPPPPSFRCAKIGVIFLIILGCFLNVLITKRASGKFLFCRELCQKTEVVGIVYVVPLKVYTTINLIFLYMKIVLKIWAEKTFTCLRVNELYKQATLTLASCLRCLKNPFFQTITQLYFFRHEDQFRIDTSTRQNLHTIFCSIAVCLLWSP